MQRQRLSELLIVLIGVMPAVPALAIERVRIPADCVVRPTSECLVDAALTSDAIRRVSYSFTSSAITFGEQGKRTLARRLVSAAQESGGDERNPGFMFNQAKAWHAAGERDMAFQMLDRAFAAVETSPAASAALDAPADVSLYDRQLYESIAAKQLEWGRPDRMMATVASLRDRPTRSVTLLEARILRQAGRDEEALDAALRLPEQYRNDVLRSMTFYCEVSRFELCMRAAAGISDPLDSAGAFALIGGHSRDPSLARKALDAGLIAYLQKPGRGQSFIGPLDGLVALAREWLRLDDPHKAIEVLDARRRRTDLFSDDRATPTNDFIERAEALGRQGRLADAFSVAAAGVETFAARPANDYERVSQMMDSAAVGRPDRASSNPARRAYDSALFGLARRGRPDDVRAAAILIPEPRDQRSIEQAVAYAEGVDTLWDAGCVTFERKAAWYSPQVWRELVPSLVATGKDEDEGCLAAVTAVRRGLAFWEELSRAQAAAGRGAAARQTLDKEWNSKGGAARSRSGALTMAKAYARIGEFDVAWDIIRTAEPHAVYPHDVLTLEAKSGRTREVLARLDGIRGPLEHIRAILAIAEGID